MHSITKTDLAAEFEKLGPWVFQFAINGETYGGSISALGDVRIEQFFRFAPGVKTILELGSLEGAQTFLLAAGGGVERVMALEGREANLRKARFIQQQLEAKKVQFAQANLEETDFARFGTFDAVFCCGLLYHLPKPWELIRRLPSVAPQLFIWTAYAPEDGAVELPNGLRGRIQSEGGLDEPLSGLSPTSTWLTLPSLVDCLKQAGFQDVQVIHDDPKHVNGPTVTIGARLKGD